MRNIFFLPKYDHKIYIFCDIKYHLPQDIYIYIYILGTLFMLSKARMRNLMHIWRNRWNCHSSPETAGKMFIWLSLCYMKVQLQHSIIIILNDLIWPTLWNWSGLFIPLPVNSYIATSNPSVNAFRWDDDKVEFFIKLADGLSLG